MREQIENREVQNQETQAENGESQTNVIPNAENAEDDAATAKPKFTKKKLAIFGGAAAVIIAIAIIVFTPSKFDQVKSECVQIAGRVTGSGDYFMIDTYPDEYENLDATRVALWAPSTQENALEAIKYANEELGFNGSVYSQMMSTTALMGRQTVENDKYRVSWTYHPDDGLEVTYEKK